MKVKIRCADGVHYVRAGRDGKLDATAERGGIWETFELVKFSDERFALRTLPLHRESQKYVRAVGGGGGALIADRDVANDHEKFTKIEIDGCKSAIQTSNGHFWRAKNGGGGKLDTTPEERYAWEVFFIKDF
jgi:hypothetical protein